MGAVLVFPKISQSVWREGGIQEGMLNVLELIQNLRSCCFKSHDSTSDIQVLIQTQVGLILKNGSKQCSLFI